MDRIREALEERDSTPILLDGVTGGGKTAIYAEAIVAAQSVGRPALVLVPEIALAVPLIDRLRADLEASIAIVHSALGEGERADEWRRIRAGEVQVVVGTRLAVTAPLADVGLIVVDEEHDAAYKSDRTPRLQARDTAIELARLAQGVVVLGSATPSVESFGRAQDGIYRSVALAERLTGATPSVEVVDLRTLRPLDKETVLDSVRKTGKCLVVYEDNRFGGYGAEVCAIVAEEAFDYLDGPVTRIAGPDVPGVPYNHVLEEWFMVNPEKIADGIRKLAAY